MRTETEKPNYNLISEYVDYIPNMTDKECLEEISKMLNTGMSTKYYFDTLPTRKILEVIQYNKRTLTERDGIECKVFDKIIEFLNVLLDQQSEFLKDLS